MRRFLLTFGLALTAGGASAEVVTPVNCQWIATMADANVSELWCRQPDGRARPTGQTLAQSPTLSGDGCPGALLYDGVACVSEDAAMAAARPGPGIGHGVAGPYRAMPRVMVLADRRGRMTRALVCVAQREALVCTAIPRR